MGARALQSCPALCDAVGCSPPGSSARGVLQARTLECVAIPSSRASSQPRDQTHSPSLACIVRWVKIPLAPRWKGPAFLKPKPGGREELKLTHTQSGHRAPGGCPLKAETGLRRSLQAQKTRSRMGRRRDTPVPGSLAARLRRGQVRLRWLAQARCLAPSLLSPMPHR